MKQSEIKAAFLKHRNKLFEKWTVRDYAHLVALNLAAELDFRFMNGIDRKDFLVAMGKDYQS